MDRKWVALVPAYEPDDRLPELICSIRQAGMEAVVIDDGSGKAYADIFSRCADRVTVLTHSVNRGKGRALKTGMAYLQQHMPEGCVVVTMDSDGQHTVSDARRLCEAAQKNPGALVLGSREFERDVPLRSRFGNTVTRLVYRLSTGVAVHDTQTGLRAFDSGLLATFLEIDGERYEYEMNVLLACTRRKIPIQEIGIETIYIDNNAASHFNTLRDSYRVYREILKFSASSFASFLIDYALYSIFSILTGGWGIRGLWASNVGARLISATVNYNINRKLVFQHEDSVAKSAAQYAALAVVILLGNTLVLSLLADGLGVNRYLAKLCTEILFFIISFSVQRLVIFRKNRDDR